MRPVKVDIRGEDCDAVKYGTLADGEAMREGVDVTAVRRECVEFSVSDQPDNERRITAQAIDAARHVLLDGESLIAQIDSIPPGRRGCSNETQRCMFLKQYGF